MRTYPTECNGAIGRDLGATWIGIRWLGPSVAKQAWSLGLLWLAMTLAFGFGAGHFLFKKPWSELLYNVNIAQGRIWVLVPLVAAMAPWLMAKPRGVI